MTVAQILASLNTLENGVPSGEIHWTEAQGTHAFPSMKHDPVSSFTPGRRNVSVRLNEVMIVKGFINRTTGEIRTYLANTIEDLPLENNPR